VLHDTGNGGSNDSPILVEEAPELASKAATKRQKLELVSFFC
jgi:hypothetical protein